MKKLAISLGTAALAAVAFAGPLRAHHSISMIEISTPVWVKGTVVAHEVVNPHTFITLEAKTEDGQVLRWTVEGPSLGRMARMGVDKDVLHAGDTIEVCGFVPKQNVSKAYPPPRFIHGNALVMPDGHMRMWGPYGKLDNCVRPDDETQTWVDFLATAPLARDAWCNSQTFAWATSIASTAFVDEVNRLMADPCH